MRKPKILQTTGIITAGLLILTACQAAAESPEETEETTNDTVKMIVHGSFDVPDFEEKASAATGYKVELVTGSGGEELSTTLALTAGAPLADAFFGIDNIFASRLTENDVVEPYRPANLGERATEHLYDDAGSLVPMTISATCLNVDADWFAENSIEVPVKYEDLLREDLKGLTALIDPTTSTTGASFLAGTISYFGKEEAMEYWEKLDENEARFAEGWSDAYYSQFTAGSEDGTKPIVLSYSSSPAYTVSDDGERNSTSSLNETCSSLVEYAGILKGAQNVAGAEALLDYLSSKEFQDEIAESMYVYPIAEDAKVPADWEEHAPFPDVLHDLSASQIGDERDAWLSELAEKIGL